MCMWLKTWKHLCPAEVAAAGEIQNLADQGGGRGEEGADLWDVSKALDDEVQGLCRAAHAPQDEDLLPDQAPLLAHPEGPLQGVPLAAHQQPHQLAGGVLCIQLHLHHSLHTFTYTLACLLTGACIHSYSMQPGVRTCEHSFLGVL